MAKSATVQQDTQNLGSVRLSEFLAGDGAPSSRRLADVCGMKPAQLCHLAKGRRVPTLEQADALNRHARIPMRAWLTPA